jgi:hypothetical protein
VLATVAELRQVGWIFRSPVVVEKGGADDQHGFGITESFRQQPRNILYYWLCSDGDIKSLLNQIYGPVCHLDEDRDFWMHRHIAGECMSQTPLSQQYRAAETNESRRFLAQFRHAVIGRLCSFNGRYTPLKEALSGFC